MLSANQINLIFYMDEHLKIIMVYLTIDFIEETSCVKK